MGAGVWYASEGLTNSAYLWSEYGAVYEAMAELDKLGHLVLQQAMSSYRGLPWETTLGFALLRRCVTQFEGVRYLCERSSIAPSSLVARALFETLLATRYFVHGTKRSPSVGTPTTPRGREIRARYYRVEELRHEIYRRQAAIDRRFGTRKLAKKALAGVSKEIANRLDFLNRHFPAQQKRYGPFRCFPPVKRLRYYDDYPWYVYGFRRTTWPRVKTIRGLASAFGWLRDYEMLYYAFSGFAHVRGLHHDTEVEPGSVAVRVSHAPDDFQTIVYFSWHWQLYMLSVLAKCYHRASRLEIERFDQRFRPALAALTGSLPLGWT